MTITPTQEQQRGTALRSSYALNRRERRFLASRGIDVNLIGAVTGRMGTRPQPGPAPAPAPEWQGPDRLPENAADWEHYLAGLDTPEAFVADFKSGKFKAALNSYAQQRNREREEMLAQMREQTEAQLTGWLKENQTALPTGIARVLDLDESRGRQGARPSPVYDNPRAKGAPLNGTWPDFYTFLQDTWFAKNNLSMSAEARERMAIYNAYSEKVPSEGGFLVPEEFRSELLKLTLDSAIVRPRATIIPMGAPRLHIPMIDETSRVSSVYGGVVVYRTEEGAELTESSASFAAIKLDVTKQTALSHVPNELIRDWGAFGAFMDSTLPNAMGYYEDLDYISGNGVGAPLGGLSPNNGALIVVNGEGGQAASTIVWQNVLRMYARMLPSSLARAVWLASPDVFVELATMALNVGTGGSAVWLTDGTGSPVLTLLGRPVIMTEKAPAALGTQGDLSLVDWSMYLVGDYQNMTVDSSPHVKFTSDKTTFRAIARNDGRPWLLSAITPRNNSATLSPFVTLATR
jgi:HK97 family phage major capsid protein